MTEDPQNVEMTWTDHGESAGMWNSGVAQCVAQCLLVLVEKISLAVFLMAALCNRAGHYIFALWFLLLSIYLLLLYPA